MSHATALELRDGESAVFGYGSLLLKQHMELTLGRTYDGPFLACTAHGWHRTWDVIMPNKVFYAETPAGRFFPQNILYLNICPRAHSLLNGVIFVVRPEELEAFDRREWIYDRCAITRDLRDLDVQGGEVYAYVGKPKFILPPDASQSFAAIRSSYLKVIEEGLCDWGADFRAQYERSTEAVPISRVMDDRKLDHGTSPLLAEREMPG